MATLEEARAAKGAALSIFSKIAPVVGVGITRADSGYSVKVNLAEDPDADAKLPQQVNGVPVKVEVVGTIRKR